MEVRVKSSGVFISRTTNPKDFVIQNVRIKHMEVFEVYRPLDIQFGNINHRLIFLICESALVSKSLKTDSSHKDFHGNKKKRDMNWVIVETKGSVIKSG